MATLKYDVYHDTDPTGLSSDIYTIYVVAQFMVLNTQKVTWTLFEHQINQNSNGGTRGFVKATLELGEDRCVDYIKASKNVIVLACASDNTILFVDRKKMELLKIDDRQVVL